jgi:TetR/AcrR family transcriptional regulator
VNVGSRVNRAGFTGTRGVPVSAVPSAGVGGRLAYIYDTYIEPMLKDVARLLAHLTEQEIIRPIPLRAFHFLLAHGATAPYALLPLATKFDPASPQEPAAIEQHATLVSTILVQGLRL